MANKTLTAKVKLDTKSAEASLDRLAKKINNVQNAINKTSRKGGLEQQVNKAVVAQERLKQATLRTQLAEERLTTQKQKTALATQKVRDATEQSAKSANKLNSAFKSSHASANGLLTTVKRLAATYLGVMGMRATIETSDTITSTQNKLNNINSGDAELTQKQMDKMYTSANKVRMAYTDMLSNASKSMTLAGGAFQGDMDNAIRFQEIMAETYALGGASAPEMSTSMYQMIQALGSGVLAGDELRSVREGAPLAYKAIEQFAQGIYNTSDSLKDMAADGMITSEIVVAAIMDAGERIDEQFDKTAITFGQAWNRIKSAAVKAFEPVSKVLSDMLNKAAENGAFEKIESAFWNISKVLQIVFQLIFNAITWIADNWSWLQHLMVAGLIIIASVWAYQGAMAIMSCIESLVALGWVAIGIMAVVACVFALIYIFYLWKTGAIDTCQAIVWAVLIVGVAITIVMAIITGGISLIPVAIAAAIALIITFLDYFLAIVYSFAAYHYNLVVGVINAIIQLIWTCFVEKYIGIIEWILNVTQGGFDSFGGAVANLIGQVISWFLSLGQVVTTIIDAIFGTNWTGGLEQLKGKVIAWGKTENAITISRDAPTVGSLTNGKMADRIAYSDAWKKGLEHGTAAKDWLNNQGGKLQNGFEGLNLDEIGKKLGLDFGNGFPTGNGVGDAYKIPDTLGNIADDTDSIADSMKLTAEDLAYLRKVAEMEWKKEFTTASIKIDMSNYNTVNGENDLDGIVTKLADKLYEEMNVVANGVYV